MKPFHVKVMTINAMDNSCVTGKGSHCWRWARNGLQRISWIHDLQDEQQSKSVLFHFGLLIHLLPFCFRHICLSITYCNIYYDKAGKRMLLSLAVPMNVSFTLVTHLKSCYILCLKRRQKIVISVVCITHSFSETTKLINVKQIPFYRWLSNSWTSFPMHWMSLSAVLVKLKLPCGSICFQS